mgnify:CR=1 FL=1
MPTRAPHAPQCETCGVSDHSHWEPHESKSRAALPPPNAFHTRPARALQPHLTWNRLGLRHQSRLPHCHGCRRFHPGGTWCHTIRASLHRVSCWPWQTEPLRICESTHNTASKTFRTSVKTSRTIHTFRGGFELSQELSHNCFIHVTAFDRNGSLGALMYALAAPRPCPVRCRAQQPSVWMQGRGAV